MKKHEKIINPDPTLQHNLMHWGFECGDGWLEIIDTALSKMETLDLPYDFEIFQIKEKFGQLKIYTSGNVDERTYEKLRHIIDEAEMKSSVTCERCGEHGKTENIHGWYITICEECKNKREKEV